MTDYIVQGARFVVVEEQGCDDALAVTGVTVVLVLGWHTLFPAISILFYCRTSPSLIAPIRIFNSWRSAHSVVLLPPA